MSKGYKTDKTKLRDEKSKGEIFHLLWDVVLLVVEEGKKWLPARQRIDLSFDSLLIRLSIAVPSSSSSPGGPSLSSSFFSSVL